MGALATGKVVRGLLLGAAILSVAACTRGSRDLEAKVNEIKAQPAPPLDPLPVMQQFASFEYAAQNLRDPFSAPVADQSGSGLRPDPNRRKEVLEAFPLDSLDMVGTIGSGSGVIALLMGPDKVTYRVRPGNYMGLSDGRVTAVFEDRVEMVELVPDGAGGWLERQAKIALEDN
ncbi:MAG: pilus assembly protein PilP [Arenimonas sp.]|uniref:pilus assembly protein PilP n=1 Tax=Arenimonas sp. TaxID=1872635 RepID=UPI0025C21C0E|nr:pilus assembly protein PilP [Arenimonas sp.]MBW8368028.1 pilus assembly protein PilP [Arenimonas sp.]